CSETGASYVIVESTIRLPGSPEDDAKAVLVQGWVVAQDALRKSGDLLVGWYRGGGGEAGLAPAAAGAPRADGVPPWRVAGAVGASPQPPQVLWPEQFGGGEGATAGGAWASGIRVRRARLWAAYATAGVLVVAGLFRLYSALASPTSPGPSQGPPEAVAVTPQ